MVLMAVLGGLLVVGLAATVRWANVAYRPWEPDEPRRGTTGGAALTYLRGFSVALVGGFWTGALVTGPAMRLIMRLLAVTAGDDAQGKLTEAEEVVGAIELDGTLGLLVFGGVLPGLLSGALYVVVRRALPAGWMGGVVFGLFHLVIAATRVDPLRAGNEDFDIVGPGWLAVLAFGAACIVHGVCVVALANRYSHVSPSRSAVAVLPLAVSALFLVPAALLLVPVGLGLLFYLVLSRLELPGLPQAGRVIAVVIGVVALPGAVVDLVDIATRG